MDEAYLTQAEFGRRTGRSQQAVSKLVRAGKIPIEIIDGKALIPFRGAQAALQRTLDPSQNPALRADASTQAASFHKLRMAQLALKVQEQQLEVAAREGKLVDKAAMERRIFELSRGLRDAILNFPNRYASVMAAELGVDARKLQFVMESRLKELLTDMADRKLGRIRTKEAR
jgi:hypothetical protein